MSEINRYTLRRCKLHFEPHICLCGTHVVPNGDLVLYSDYAALEAENGRLRAPVSDAEWEAANYRQAVETGLGESSTDGKMLVWHTYTSRDKFDALIAARAQQRSPAQDKEQG